ncbi:MAG: hypothetical protein JEZ08_01445 [Clostridiales bacterium]|nr:hypothetical protein [Clostridiales bacterium]
MLDIHDNINTQIMRHMKPKLENLVSLFGLNIENNGKFSNDLIAELTHLIRDMHTKPYIPLAMLKDDDAVFVINMVDEKLYYMDLLYGVEMSGKAVNSNIASYNKNTVLCIHIDSKRLIKFN